jgi:uncharacterized protein YjiK
VLNAQGQFSLTTAFLQDGTQDGVHTITVFARDVAGNVSAGAARTLTLDTKAPTLLLTSLADGAALDTASRLTGSAAPNGSTLTQLSYRVDGGAQRSVIFDAATGTFDQVLTTGALDVGDHVLTLTARDAAGNQTTLQRAVKVQALTRFTVTSLTPANGNTEVGVTFRPQVTFSRAVNPSTLTSTSFYATGPDGNKLDATIVPAQDGSFAWLFINGPMPGGARITLHVDGSKIRAAADGAFLDADVDGVAGGMRTGSFSTVSTAVVAGTSVVGRVVDPGGDLLPMTFDDIRRGPDGVIHTPDDVFLNPIAHAKVYILGRENEFVYTDAQGFFTLSSVPTGTVKLAVDGRTATNAPTGVFWPEMVMDVQIEAGIANTVMGSMGTDEERLANGDRKEIYLPRVATSVLKSISATEATVLTIDENASPNLTDSQRESMTLTITPGAAVDERGQIIADPKIGISTVPPELVRDMLPPGVLQHTFDITIQAPGVATFAQPMQITFPNVFNAAPGTKLNVLSFDHTTGMLVINGTATVSADGKTVVSDEGSGIKAPGWHGVTPPGDCGDGSNPPPPPPPPPTPADTEGETAAVVKPLLFGESGAVDTLTWKAPDKLPDTPPPPPPDPNCPTPPRPEDPNGKQQPYLTVTIDVDGPLADFMKKSGNLDLVSQSFTLTAGSGETKTFSGSAKTYAEIFGGLKNLETNVLYGSKISITEVTGKSDGSKHTQKSSYFLYRFVDATDADHEDKRIEFEDSLVGVSRSKAIDMRAGGAAPTLSASGAFSVAGSDVQFAPTAVSNNQSGTLTIKAPNGNNVGTVSLLGDGQAKQRWQIDIDTFFNGDDFMDAMSNAFASDMTEVEKAIFGTANGAGTLVFDAVKTLAFVNDVVAEAERLLAPFSAGVERVTSSDSNTVVFDDLEKDFFEGGGGELGTAFIVDNSSGSYSTAEIRTNRSQYSKAEQNFRLSEALNEDLGGHVDIYVDQYFQQEAADWTRAQLLNSLGKTIAHELGHNVGLNHTNNWDGTDVMAQGFVKGAQRAFGTTTNAFKVAVAMSWSMADAQQAIDYYVKYLDLGGGDAQDPDTQQPPAIGDGLVALFDAASGDSIGGVDFGTLNLASGQATRTIALVNIGDQPLVISGAHIDGGQGNYSINLPKGPITLEAGARREFEVSFAPVTTGRHDARLVVESDGLHAVTEFDLNGTAKTTTPKASISFANNNLGGVAFDGSSAQRSRVATITNHGDQTLVISKLSFAEGDAAFDLLGLPADLAANPIRLAYGESFSFGASFTADSAGLARGLIRMQSNDASAPAIIGSVVGTGLSTVVYPQWGDDYISIETNSADGSNVLTAQSDVNGRFSFFLPQLADYHLRAFDPVTGLISHGRGSTGPSGGGTDLTRNLVFLGSTANDSDFDGLPDDIEAAIGSNPNGSDTDKDGLDDFTEIAQGLDPLGGLGIPVGVASAATFNGTAEAVAVMGAVGNSSQLTAVVATGSYGLALVDATRILEPRLLAELDLPGNNTDVALDTVRGLAAIAAGDAGLHIVDVSNPSQPVLLQTISFADAVTRVEVRDGFAFVTAGSQLAMVDLNTGDLRQMLELGGGTLTDIAMDGNLLLTMDSSGALNSITVNGSLMSKRDVLNVVNSGGKLFAGGGVVYVGTTQDFAQGYSTVSSTDPANLALLSGVDAVNVAGQALAANGSGLLVSTGNLRGPRGEQLYVLDVSSAADPSDTDAFLTRVTLPARPLDLALANGLAFVADGSSGLQIVNYRTFDTLGVAPTVTITVDGVDVDPGTPGIQILEGRTVQIKPIVTDDVQVRSVELLVNGQVVSSDPNFPFELFAQAPAINTAGNTITLQVRATDTGGNTSLSNAVVLTVVPDTFAPQVTDISLGEGARVFFVRAVNIAFDEPLDTSKLAASGVSLVRAGADAVFGTADDVVVPVTLDSRAFGQSISVLPVGYLLPGDYELRVDPSVIADKAGNALGAAIVRHFSVRPASDIRASSGVPAISQAPSANPGQQIGLPVPFDPKTARATFNVTNAAGVESKRDLTVSRVDAARGVAYFTVPLDAVTGEIEVFSQVGNVKTSFPDGVFLLQILPLISDVQVESVSADGSSAQVLLSGFGFVEGGDSEYRFGDQSVLDAGVGTGPDVFDRYDPSLGQYVGNGYARVTVALVNGVFGAISVKTAGGVSASYSVVLSGVDAVALSGTPKDAAQASANAGQTVTLQGSGLSTSTDILLRWTDINGTLQMTRLSPSAAASDGSSATLSLPSYANGAYSLQVFGSASQPLLQIVPKLQRYDQQDRLVLFGSGFVEGASSYTISGSSVQDDAAQGNHIDVYYDGEQNGSAYLDRSALPNHGLGNVSVTTAGGTSAPLALNNLQVTVQGTSLGDVAIDPVSGAMWVSDYSNPGHLLRIDTGSGDVLQTLTLSNAYGVPYTYNYAGLQILDQAVSLGGTSVAAGSLLVFNGYANPDRVLAINPSDGSLLASLVLTGNHDLTAGVFDPQSGHLFVSAHNGNQLLELDAATGAVLNTIAAPVNVQSWAGLALDPRSGNLWVGSTGSANQVVEITRAGTEVRRIDLAGQGVNNNEISGLAFDADGNLFVASTQGVVYKIDTERDPAVQAATLSQVLGVATDGTPTNAALASANVGQAIELRGSHFGAGTQVLFDTRDANGNVSTVTMVPQAISADGTRLQVLVPDLATTGNVRVVNSGASNLGFAGFNDAIYRSITTTFTAGSANATLRFADGGLQGLGDESWGLDNVNVRLGGTSIFSDDFEGAAKAQWSDASIDDTNRGNFSRFSGRFNNASQTLNLSGLTAGQTYTLSFDLYAIDSWDGNRPDAGPDLIQVSADGQAIFKASFANNYTAQAVQTYGTSAGIRLQIVPTLTGVNGRPGGDGVFNLIGSGFMEGASTVRIGGINFNGSAGNGLDVSGARNDTFGVVAPHSLDGPIRVTTEGGWVQLPGPVLATPPIVDFTALNASAASGNVADAAQASANTGQVITLTGQGFTNQTLVQFQGIDDTGALGTITRSGNASNGGTTLSIQVPAQARSGALRVLGSDTSFALQIVPTLQAVGGSVAVGNTLVLQGSGLVAGEITVQIDGIGVGSFSVRTIIDGSGLPSYAYGSSTDQQLLVLTVPNGVGNGANGGVITISTQGGSSTLRGRPVGVTNASNVPNAGDIGETLASAALLNAAPDQRFNVAGTMGDGAQSIKDVDLYRLQLNAGDQLSLDLQGSATYTHLRLFDANGTELATQYFPANSTSVLRTRIAATGTYYVGISDYYNLGYDPKVAGSGSNASFSGTYQLGIERLGAGNRHLVSITAPALSGTAAQAGVAAANVNQTLTLNGSGFVSGEPVVFSMLDSNGRLFEQQFNPASVDADGTHLTVVVPVGAVTGTVRLARDTNGVFLQIVPTLGDISANPGSVYNGGGLILRGSGFAEGASSVLFGGQVLADASRGTGLDVYGGYISGNNTLPYGENTTLGLSVPPGMPTGPIQVRTIGGTSAAFGVTITGVVASASSGIPASNNQASAVPGQAITLKGSGLDTSTDIIFETTDNAGNRNQLIVRPSTVNAAGTELQVLVPYNAVTGVLRVVGDTNARQLALQILPLISDVQVESVSADGSSAQVLLSGFGFVEGGDSEYRFGDQSVLDAGVGTGPDVFDRYDPSLGQYVGNGYARVTVALVNGVFGAISVKTAGGVSASYSVVLSGVDAVALSGTPKDAAQASANAGQTVTLQGSGLSTSTDILLRWTDINGTLQMTRLSPSAAASDGSSATLSLPSYANGAYSLQVFGSASQPLLQIVPKLQRYDQQDRLVLFGSGFVEGASSYTISGSSVQDDAAQGNHIDVYYDGEQNGSAYLDRSALPNHGLGNVSVTTAGGTSAPLALNNLQVTVQGTSLGDVAIDPVSGAMWVSDYSNPGHLLRIDTGSGDVLQTLTLSNAYGVPYTYNYAGLQILDQAVSLGGTSVAAGSLLVFNGYANPDRVLAINPSDGSLLASLVLTGNHDLTAGVFDPQSGHLFVSAHNGNQLLELDAATGAVLNTIAAPVNVQSWAGLALDPRSGNLWVGSTGSANQVVEITRAGTEVRRIDLAGQGVNNNEISGLAFDADGNLFVASTQGVVYKIDTERDPAVQAATLSQVLGVATDGTPTNAALASANVGQAIELRGSHFGAGTQVLFDTRDANGNVSTVTMVPQAISADGTRLQVLVPDLATTGNVRVVNSGASNLGFAGFNDAIYRSITTTFTAGSANATLRFADGGLQGLGDESWGLDNVNVRLGGTSIFSDDFEGAAKAQWSDASIDDTNRGNFSRFSGRFNNASQTLNLSGLTAGQTYTLSFDLYAIDSWDGNRPDAGPDLIQVSADGQAIFKASFANNYTAQAVQTYGTSAGIRLQIVPTLTGVNGRPGGDGVFNLIGSGFMEGASTVRIGGINFNGSAGNGLDVSGARNDTFGVVAPHSLDGPIRVTTEGGWVQLPGPVLATPPIVDFTALNASAASGNVADAAQASANTGQVITLTGQGFTNQTLVQFQGIDDTGALGTITRSGNASNGGTTLSIQVPAQARSGALRVLGSDTSFALQIVPTLQAVGGSVAVGNTLVLQGSGLVAGEITVQIDGIGVGSFSVRTIIDGSGLPSYAYGSSTDQQLLVLTVPNGVGNGANGGVITISTQGGSSTLRGRPVGVTNASNVPNAGDIGETLASAALLNAAPDQRFNVAGTMGDGAQSIKDVDLYRLQLNAGDQLSLDLQGSATYTHLRLFDANGTELATQYFPANSTSVLRTRIAATGTYYVGISDYYNLGYDPKVAGSGSNASFSGTYQLGIERLGAGNRHLVSITAPALSGTAAQAGVAAANVNQTLTLNGSGFVSGEPVVFSMLDSNGRLFEQQFNPASVDADGTHLTVVVPVGAVTGTVRLARDTNGVFLQIVPTLGDISANPGSVYNGGGLILRGSGFAEGASSVLFGGQVLADASRGTGLDVYGGYISGNNTLPYGENTTLGLSVPPGMPTGPIQVRTIGGTSAAFGVTITGVVASASSGIPASNNQASAVPGQAITLKGSGLDTSTDIIFETTDNAGNRNQLIVRPSTVNAAGTELQVLVPYNAVTGVLRVVGDTNARQLALQILPLISDVQVESVSADGSSAQVLLSGFGFVEGGDSEYRFGDQSVLDAGVGTGPDVFDRYDPSLGQYVGNGYARVTVALVNGVFGAISVKTAGGVSASYSVVLSGVDAVALSGTPKDAAQASANAGQTVTLQGSGLSTSTDILLRWTDINGTLQMTRLSPSAAASDGSSATLSLPSYANGAYSLQVFGSASQPLLQIVPKLQRYDQQDRLVLFGSGFVEGASSYTISGSSVQDDAAQGNHIDVYYDGEQNGSAYLDRSALPNHGLGNVSVTTAGGTSAPLALNNLQVTVQGTSLGDVAIDPVSGAMWVSDYSNPGHLLRIDTGSGDVLQTLTLSNAYGVPYTYNYAGLQILDQAVSLGGTSVAAGSLLVFNGYANPDRVLAINPSDGSLLASLVLTGNHDLTAGVFDPQSGHLFVSAHNGNQLLELDAATGAVLNTIAAPVNVQSWAGLALDPRSGNLWVGSTGSANQVVEITRAGTEVRRIDLAGQGVNNNEISGLAFDADGNLFVASTQGVVYKIVVPA